MAVRHQLAGSGARRSDAQTIYHIVQTAFEQLQQVLARDAAHTGRLIVRACELLLQQTVRILGFLFFAQLRAVLRHFLALTRQTVLSGRKVALFEHLVRTVNSFAELSGDLRFWSYVFSHCFDFFKTLEIFLTPTQIIRGGG